MNDEFNALLAELTAALGGALPRAKGLRQFNRNEARDPQFKRSTIGPESAGNVRFDPNRANYGLAPQTPGDYLSAGAEALWQGMRRSAGQDEDEGAFAPGSGGDLVSRILPMLHPATGLPLLAYQGGRAGGAVYNAASDPSAENVATAGLESAFVPFMAAPGARGMAAPVRNMLASRTAGLAGVGVGAAGIGAGMGISSAEAARKKNAEPPATGVEATDSVLNAMRKQMKDLQNQRENSRKSAVDGINQQMQKLQADYNDRLAILTKAKLPFDQAFPEAAQVWPFIQALGPLAMGAALRGKGAIGEAVARRPWNNALSRGERALSDGDPALATASAGRANAFLQSHKSFPALISRRMEDVSPVLGGAGVGAELNALPAQYDAAMAPPGSPEQTYGAERARDPWTYIRGAGVGALSAATGAHLVPGGRAPIARTNALAGQVGKTPAETAQLMADGLTARGTVAGARTGLQASEMTNAALLKRLQQELDAKLAAPIPALPPQPGPAGGPLPPQAGNPPPQAPPNRKQGGRKVPSLKGAGANQSSKYSGDVKRDARAIWDAELSSVNPAQQATYAPDVQALSTAMAAELKKAGHNVSTEALAKRITASQKVMDLIRSTGGDPFTKGGRDLMTSVNNTLGLAMSALAAEEMYRSGQQR